MKCTFCGAELNDDAVFCTECGRAVEIAAEPVKPEKNPGKIFGIISFALAAVALIAYLPCSCCGIFSIAPSCIAIILAVVAFIFAIIGNKKSKAAGHKNALAKAALIIAIVTLALIVLGVLLFALYYVLNVVLGSVTGVLYPFSVIGLGILREIL